MINRNLHKEENTMKTMDTFECGMCYFQGSAKDFTPTTASANNTVLECPNCLNNDCESFYEVETEDLLAA